MGKNVQKFGPNSLEKAIRYAAYCDRVAEVGVYFTFGAQSMEIWQPRKVPKTVLIGPNRWFYVTSNPRVVQDMRRRGFWVL